VKNMRTGNDKVRLINAALKNFMTDDWDELNKMDGTYEMKKEAIDMLQGFVDEVDFLIARVKLYNRGEIEELLPILRDTRKRLESYHKSFGGCSK